MGCRRHLRSIGYKTWRAEVINAVQIALPVHTKERALPLIPIQPPRIAPPWRSMLRPKRLPTTAESLSGSKCVQTTDTGRGTSGAPGSWLFPRDVVHGPPAPRSCRGNLDTTQFQWPHSICMLRDRGSMNVCLWHGLTSASRRMIGGGAVIRENPDAIGVDFARRMQGASPSQPPTRHTCDAGTEYYQCTSSVNATEV